MKLTKLCVVTAMILACFCVLPPRAAASDDKVRERIQAATDVFNQVTSSPDKGIPEDLLSKAHCIAIIPSMKRTGLFVTGSQYGRGVVTCRTASGWSPPSMVMIAGGSFGLQLGAQAVDLVMLVMNEKGKDFLFHDKFTMGGDASVAAGPVGRHASAETNATMNAQILTWSRSRGVFGGISLNGATLRPDKGGNRTLYGSDVTARDILAGKVTMPETAQPLVAAIARQAGQTGVESRR